MWGGSSGGNFNYAATLSLIMLIVLNVVCFTFLKLARVRF